TFIHAEIIPVAAGVSKLPMFLACRCVLPARNLRGMGCFSAPNGPSSVPRYAAHLQKGLRALVCARRSDTPKNCMQFIRGQFNQRCRIAARFGAKLNEVKMPPFNSNRPTVFLDNALNRACSKLKLNE